MPKSPREVVLAAANYLAEVTPPTQKIGDVRVEEVIPMSEEKGFWRVVLSYDSIGSFAFDKKREYKEFKVSDTDGSVAYMKSVDGK